MNVYTESSSGTLAAATPANVDFIVREYRWAELIIKNTGGTNALGTVAVSKSPAGTLYGAVTAIGTAVGSLAAGASAVVALPLGCDTLRVTLTSASGSIELRAGDDVAIEKGAFVDADTAIVLRADFNSADAAGATITVEGALQAPGMQLHGGEQADTIVLRPESLVGDTQVFGPQGRREFMQVFRTPRLRVPQSIMVDGPCCRRGR
jgi:hypothetical protein